MDTYITGTELYNTEESVGYALPETPVTALQRLFFNNQAAKAPATVPDATPKAATVAALYSQIKYLMDAMVKAGFPSTGVLAYCVAQMMFESNWLTSNVARTDNNYTGIKYLGKSYQHATKGLPSPEGGNYAHFATFGDFLTDYKRILSLSGSKGRPIDAQSAAQFGDALRANHYFTDPNYSTKFNQVLAKVREAMEWGQKQDQQFLQQYNAGERTFTTTAGKGLTSNEAFDKDRSFTKLEHWVEDHPLAAAGIGLGLVVIVVAAVK
jgi:flagellum-specific peptidoglycan hydrolase FlgJ